MAILTSEKRGEIQFQIYKETEHIFMAYVLQVTATIKTSKIFLTRICFNIFQQVEKHKRKDKKLQNGTFVANNYVSTIERRKGRLPDITKSQTYIQLFF